MVTPIPELQMQRYLNDINERHGLTCADATVLLDQCTALQQERDQLKAQQAWLDRVGPPDHPDDERHWVGAYLDTTRELTKLQQERDQLQQSAQQAALALDEAIGLCNVPEDQQDDEWRDQLVQCKQALAALKNVGVTP